MGKESDFSSPPLRADRPGSPGEGRDASPFPRGIEVLVKKAAIDPDFRELLLTDPDEACQAIGLELDPIEAAMLKAVGREQLIAVIDRTRVPDEHRRAFLGKTALKTDDGRKVVKILAKQFRVEPKTITAKTQLVEDLKATRSSMALLRTQLTQALRIYLPPKDFSKAKTVLDLMDLVVAAQEKKAASQQISRGVRPDIPSATKGIGGSFGLRP